MEPAKIFISYSHQDAKALKQIQEVLRPLERDGLVGFWDDTKIDQGQDWAKEIDAALDGASIAVLVISRPFIASDFIFEQELPRIFARRASDGLTVLPIFLSPFDTETSCRYRDQDGQEKSIKLTELQGLGRPDKTLSDLTWSDRDRQYATFATRLRALAKQAPDPAGAAVTPVGWVERSETHHPPRRANPDRSATTEPGTGAGYTLTAALTRRDKHLEIRWFLPGSEAIAAITRPWSEVADLLASDGREFQLPPAEQRKQRGEDLFRVLFGQDIDWQPLLRTVFRQPEPQAQPNPVRAPLRLRINSDDPLLLAQPWQWTVWNGLQLTDYGWEFLTTREPDPDRDCHTTAPANLLVLTPEDAEKGHLVAFRDAVRQCWPSKEDPPGYLRVVHTRDQLKNALRGMAPHMVYVYGQARCTATGAELRLQDDRYLGLQDLADLLGDLPHPPDLIYLNVAGLSQQQGANPGANLGPGPGQVLDSAAALVVWRRSPQPSAEADSRVIAWLRRWLDQREDPITALYQVRDTDDGDDAANLAIHARYRNWSTAAGTSTFAAALPHLILDRDQQKALVAKHLRELVRSETRRVMALVAYAAAGNRIADLREQLRYELELAVADVAEIDWPRLQFPATRGADLHRDLESELRLQLGADPGETTRQLLQRLAPPVADSDKRPVLWLDWGVFGRGGGQQAPLLPPHYEAWLRFCGAYLSARCPDTMRIVCFAAVEIEPKNHKKVAGLINRQRAKPWCQLPAMRLSLLPPLGDVSEEHLFDVLEDGNCHCDPNIRVEVAARLIEKTGGRFDETAALMQESEDGSWYDLLTRLQREQEGPDQEDDEASWA